eukprot:m.115799 g.115799  ORF g.115799 m.115799 type:complete len:58 (+) comp37564_c0_seq1:1428-1601(+)
MEVVLLLGVEDEMLSLTGSRLFYSFQAVEAAANRLKLMQRTVDGDASTVQTTWDELK